MLWLLRFISGFLKIRLSGGMAEQIINSAAVYRLRFWGLRYKRKTIIGWINVRDFKSLRDIRRGTGVKIEILERHGLPFLLHRYRKRYGLAVGAALFFAILQVLSSFIWQIDVEGNKKISDSEIIADCAEIGIYEGILKSVISPKSAAQELLLKSESLAWAALNIEGCRLTVNVSEIKNPIDKSLSEPSNLVAAEDGIVKKIDITSGNALVSVGDAVCRGDILVSGISERMNSTVFEPSVGKVIAEVHKTVRAESDFEVTLNKENGKLAKRSVLEIFSLKIPLYLGEVRGSFNKEYKTETAGILGQRLPIKIHTATFEFTEKTRALYTESQLEIKLQNELKQLCENAGYSEYTVKKEKIIPKKNGMILEWEIKYNANIGAFSKINSY